MDCICGQKTGLNMKAKIRYPIKRHQKMSTEDNIKDFINQYEGTAIGESVKNMYENGIDFEFIKNLNRRLIPIYRCEMNVTM